MNKKDIILKYFFDENGSSKKLLKPYLSEQILGVQTIGNESLTREEYFTILSQLIDAKYILSDNSNYIPLKKLEEVFKIGGFEKRDIILLELEKQKKIDLQRQRDNVEASIRLSKATTWIGSLTVAALIVQCIIYYLQYNAMQEQNKLQIKQNKEIVLPIVQKK